ncbi:MAG: YihY/virulence factor BrkB family protein [Bacteroidia bacterium]|nr:YihY/virulence factor BrkB family protein [Bacteroidia bacterium]
MLSRLQIWIQSRIQYGLMLLRGLRLPGFEEMTVLDVLVFFFRGLLDPRFTLMASAMSYQFFFSLFPTLLLLFILLPLVPVPGLQEDIVAFIGQVVPSDGVDFIERLVEAQFSRSADLALALVSVLLALWGGLRGIIAMIKAFSRRDEVFKRRNLFQLYRVALGVFVSLGVTLVLAVLFISLIDNILHWFVLHQVFNEDVRTSMYRVGRFLITSGGIFLMISLIYYLAPPVRRRWPFVSAGTLVATGLTLLANAGLNYYFVNFAQYDKIYGSLGAIILLMVWFYYISIVLLIGFELNAAIYLASWHDQRLQEQEENAESPA